MVLIPHSSDTNLICKCLSCLRFSFPFKTEYFSLRPQAAHKWQEEQAVILPGSSLHGLTQLWAAATSHKGDSKLFSIIFSFCFCRLHWFSCATEIFKFKILLSLLSSFKCVFKMYYFRPNPRILCGCQSPVQDPCKSSLFLPTKKSTECGQKS